MISYKREVRGCMKNERKPITVRVSPELKFQIDKAAVEDNRTINSWIIHVIKQYLESVKK
jgi:predicted HicB family RNase H-like nuclease